MSKKKREELPDVADPKVVRKANATLASEGRRIFPKTPSELTTASSPRIGIEILLRGGWGKKPK